jgi:hypothetical protein
MVYFYIGSLKIILNKKRLKKNIIKLLQFCIILLSGLLILKTLHVTLMLGYLLIGIISYIITHLINYINILKR